MHLLLHLADPFEQMVPAFRFCGTNPAEIANILAGERAAHNFPRARSLRRFPVMVPPQFTPEDLLLLTSARALDMCTGLRYDLLARSRARGPRDQNHERSGP